MDTDRVLNDVRGAMDIYHVMAVRLQWLITILGIVAVSCLLAVTSLADILSVFWIKISSFVSLLIFTLFTTFNVSGKHNDLRKAWRHLNFAYLQYEADKLNLGQLVDAKYEAELMLGYIEFDLATIKPKENQR